MEYCVVGATYTWKVPVATSLLLSVTWQVTVLEKRGKVDPEAGVQLPGVAPGIAGGVDHVATHRPGSSPSRFGSGERGGCR